MTFCLPLSWLLTKVEAWQAARKKRQQARLKILTHV